MSLWAKYAKERLGVQTIETDYGFLTYKINADDASCLVCDFFVDPDHRRSGHGRELVRQLFEIAKTNMCFEVRGNVWPHLTGADKMLLIALKNGFKVRQALDGSILIALEVNHG